MKSLSLVAVLLVSALIGDSIAEVETTYYADGRVQRVRVAPDTGIDKRSGCNRDNCLRAMVRRPDQATSLCHSYTTASMTATDSFGSFQTPCKGLPARVSSACSCAVAPVIQTQECAVEQDGYYKFCITSLCQI
ncbi:hypothetical protein B0I35DRAFT_415135 [Stachybotrys elegans]|uniref:Uncharacterized protein n=1 Tax=Stachybotrys elegans TaxID=80388 RepID=A0A8K0WJZ3_9HYPO|nr:hypothetical protein B0I35DRAFT_415135 [Stachybotrys elegans]